MAAEITQWSIQEAREPAKAGSVVMDGWELKKLLGKGGSGSVWLAEKNLLGIKAQSAVKIINIPHDPGDLDVMRREGFTREQIQTELQDRVHITIREIQAMLKLRGQPAVVFCESFDIIQYENDGTWDILIRMELLEPLTEWVTGRTVQEEDVRKLGITLADLLAECEENKILHRDIKPSNIFIDQKNNFKLGDFGLARIQSDAKSVYSKGVGTDAFMSPEVSYGEPYDYRADLYSLGLVMYWLLNNQHLPFAGGDVSRSRAITKRLAGEKLPELTGVNLEFAQIIQKACAYKPEDRYQTAKDLALALQENTEQSTGSRKTKQIKVEDWKQPALDSAKEQEVKPECSDVSYQQIKPIPRDHYTDQDLNRLQRDSEQARGIQETTADELEDSREEMEANGSKGALFALACMLILIAVGFFLVLRYS